MSKVQLGILGGWIGKLGTTVGFFWKGKAVTRAYKDKVRNPKTDKQKLVRAKFRMLGQLSRELLNVTKLGLLYVSHQKKVTESNTFMKTNYDAVTGSSPQSLALNYDALVVALGSVSCVQFGTPDFSQEGEVTVPIEAANIGTFDHADDSVWLVAFCPDMHAAAMSEGAEVRTDETVTVKCPRTWTGLKVYLYGFVKSVEDSQCSDSAYCGFGIIS